MGNQKALLVIDVQVAMFDESYPVYEGERLLQKIEELIHKARAHNIPVFFIQHNKGAGKPLETGTPGSELHPRLAPSDQDIVIQKDTPDSFNRTTLHEELQAKGVNELILAGIQTELCVDTTFRRAYGLGYRVTLASDAHSTWNNSSLSAQQIIDHHNETLRFFGTVKKSEEVI